MYFLKFLPKPRKKIFLQSNGRRKLKDPGQENLFGEREMICFNPTPKKKNFQQSFKTRKWKDPSQKNPPLREINDLFLSVSIQINQSNPNISSPFILTSSSPFFFFFPLFHNDSTSDSSTTIPSTRKSLLIDGREKQKKRSGFETEDMANKYKRKSIEYREEGKKKKFQRRWWPPTSTVAGIRPMDQSTNDFSFFSCLLRCLQH